MKLDKSQTFKQMRGFKCKNSLYAAGVFLLTISNLDVFEGHLWAWVTDQHLSIQSEHDVHLHQVNHASHHVSRLPLPPEGLISNVPALSLEKKKQYILSIHK